MTGRQTVGRQGDHARVTMLELYLALKLMPVQCVCVCVCCCVCSGQLVGQETFATWPHCSSGNWQLAPVQACTWRQVLIVFPIARRMPPSSLHTLWSAGVVGRCGGIEGRGGN